MTSPEHQLVQLANGLHTVYSVVFGEKMHPVLGPAMEAKQLYVGQLQLAERLRNHTGEFVIWDVGLGATANAIAALRAVCQCECSVRIVSFDNTITPAVFALEHAGMLGYLDGYIEPLSGLLKSHRVEVPHGGHTATWELRLGDFPLVVADRNGDLPAPHGVMFDAYSPAKNPAMWTLPFFTRLYGRLYPKRPCLLASYTRSTMVRVTLLLAGFYVGIGEATGEKEETTVAANDFGLLAQPLKRDWLERVRRSGGAEPLHEPVYRQAGLSAQSWQRLEAHPQFVTGSSTG